MLFERKGSVPNSNQDFRAAERQHPQVSVKRTTRKRLGNIPEDLIAIREQLKGETEKLRILEWTGDSAVPRGAIIGGMEVAHADRDGFLVSTRGEDIGYYDRLKHYSGKNHNEHSMVAYLLQKNKPMTSRIASWCRTLLRLPSGR